MKERNNPEKTVLYILLGIVAFVVLLRVPVFGAYAIRLLLLAVFGLLLYGAYRLFLLFRERQREKAFQKTTEGRIAGKLEQCRSLLQTNDQEMEDILDNIRDLEAKVNSTVDISEQYRRESKELLSAFRSEHKLRQAKARFYDSCTRKLESLLHNQQLASEIESKKERLRELQENHYEELAKLEEIKSDLEMDTFYLDTIDELSTRMLKSSTFDDAEHLRLELETMTRDLDEL